MSKVCKPGKWRARSSRAAWATQALLEKESGGEGRIETLDRCLTGGSSVVLH